MARTKKIDTNAPVSEPNINSIATINPLLDTTSVSESLLPISGPVSTPILVPVKGKRGRKSKKELMAALGVAPIVNLNSDNVTLNITELNNNNNNNNNIVIIPNPNLDVGSVNNILLNDNDSEKECDEIVTPDANKQPMKKRGRKPKGGKIIQQVTPTEILVNDKPNVILHLKCSMKDLQNSTNSNNVESYTFNTKNLCYDVVGGENINSINAYNLNTNSLNNNSSKNNNIVNNTNNYHNYDEDEDDDDCNASKDTNKDIWRKLKQLEHNLHTNNVNNKKCACFWDSCDFDNPPIFIPKHFINGTYHVYGNFCSPECGVAYLMNENIDSSTKFERYHLFNHIYSKIFDYKKNIKPSPNPHYMLEKFYGNLSIQEYRSLLRNERLFIIVDKPLTRILPELLDDNDEFILNSKIIPSNNNYQLKSRMQKRKADKNTIVNEKFGMNSLTTQKIIGNTTNDNDNDNDNDNFMSYDHI
jgi:hypothetical protein